jgi:putative transposase
VRPATGLICQFIDQHKQEHGVVPVCRALSAHGIQIAPRTYWAYLRHVPSRRELWDTAVTEVLAGIYEPGPDGRRQPESMYGTLKVWDYLRRQGIEVAKCTVDRIKREHGWQGRTRSRRIRTTIPDPAAARAPDLVNRQFRAERPGQLHVADFTYVALSSGRFAYTAFVIDAYAGLIPGWECSGSKQTGFIESALRQAMEYRRRNGQPLAPGAVHHSDAGSQYTSIHFGETLLIEGLRPSIGTVGDAYDNALAETTIGLYKTECIREDSPFRTGPLHTLADVEDITSQWVHWYNTSRLMHRLGRRPPAEAETQYWSAPTLATGPAR